MAFAVVTGASVKCAMGQVGSLTVTSNQKRLVDGKPVATIKDSASGVNISPCGMCTSLLNPTVAAATAAALGVLTPQPCIPNTTGTWIPTQLTDLTEGAPTLTSDATCVCTYGGVISVVMPGQSTIMIG